MTTIQKITQAMEAERVKPRQFGRMAAFEDYARAALTALLEPSEGMLDAGVKEDSESGYSDNPENIWRVMIQHALDEVQV